MARREAWVCAAKGGEGAGPRYAQTSNAYRPTLAEKMLAYLPRWMRPAPVPDDHDWSRSTQAKEAQTMLDALPAGERAATLVGGSLGALLARLGASVEAQERESHKAPEPLTHSYSKNRRMRSGPANERFK